MWLLCRDPAALPRRCRSHSRLHVLLGSAAFSDRPSYCRVEQDSLALADNFWNFLEVPLLAAVCT
jgi:hypothetical protein